MVVGRDRGRSDASLDGGRSLGALIVLILRSLGLRALVLVPLLTLILVALLGLRILIAGRVLRVQGLGGYERGYSDCQSERITNCACV